jgi:hypothetical protein
MAVARPSRQRASVNSCMSTQQDDNDNMDELEGAMRDAWVEQNMLEQPEDGLEDLEQPEDDLDVLEDLEQPEDDLDGWDDQDISVPIDLNDLLESSIFARDSLRSFPDGLRTQFRVELRELSGEGLAVAIDEGGPFQLWLGRLAQLLFGPRAALFLPAEHDGRTWTRISPRPGIGCVEPSILARLDAAGEQLELYRLAGNVLGLALRPWRSPYGILGPNAPFILGDVVRLVPSVCQQLLLGDDYDPHLDDLRSTLTPHHHHASLLTQQ